MDNDAGKVLSTERTEYFELYKLMVEMADRVSQRRQSSNSFYLSINTLLLGGSTYLGISSPNNANFALIAVAGIIICVLWRRSIESYKTLNDAKFKVINKMEEGLSFAPYSTEWASLDPNKDGIRHRPFNSVEKLIPLAFSLIYSAQGILLIPWNGFRHLADKLSVIYACFS